MKAISLWQPWASAMALGYKRIETRHWATRYRGPLAIHAAKRFHVEERGFADAMARAMSDPRLGRHQHHLGAIVAIGELVKIDRTEDIASRLEGTIEAEWGDYGPSRFGWRLERIRALVEPIPWRGAQGIFYIPDDVVRAVAVR